jgi:hypothetical protein
MLAQRHLLDATSAIFFFGVGHLGFENAEETEAMVTDLSDGMDNARLRLSRQLKEYSEFLETQREDLVDIWPGRRIFSFYETEFTPTLQKVRTQQPYATTDLMVYDSRTPMEIMRGGGCWLSRSSLHSFA